MRFLTFILISMCASAIVSAKTSEEDDLSLSSSLLDSPNRKLTILEGWENMEKKVKNVTRTLLKMALPKIMENPNRKNLSSNCTRDMMILLSGVNDIKSWAMKFIDSSGKIMSGLLSGSYASLGSYDECVDTVVKSTKPKDESKVLFTGQYCNVDITSSMPKTPIKRYYKVNSVPDELKNFSKGDSIVAEATKSAHFLRMSRLEIGICLPSGCSMEDANRIVKMARNDQSASARVRRCEVKREKEYPPITITAITCFSFVGFLVLVGSLIDLQAYYREIIYRNKAIRILTAFSLLSNFQKFTNTKTSSSTLSCLNGIRFLSMTWIIVCHTYLYMPIPLAHSLSIVNEVSVDFAFQVILNGTVAVDTFFCMGGLLVCYLTIKNVRQQKRRFNIIMYIVHRLWRILPAYSLVIMSVFMTNLLGSGPIWADVSYYRLQSCSRNWWVNLLFINNFYDTRHLCMGHTWYVAADFQMYIGALIILLPMLRWPRFGIFLSIVGVVASAVYAGVVSYINDYPPTVLMIPDYQFLDEFNTRYFFKPFMHAQSYCIGILAGYILATKPDIKIPPVVQVVGWSLAFVSNFTVLYGVIGWNRGADPSFWGGLLYASLYCSAWALGIAWMIVCCATGHGGFINYFLSWKAFTVLGRLSYLAYLVHPLVEMAFIGNLRTQVQGDHFVIVWYFLGHLCVTYAVSFAGSMLIEAPFINLEKILVLENGNKKDDITLVIENNIQKDTLKTNKNGDIMDIKWIKVDEDLRPDQQQISAKL